jgi:hypothetical protein
MPLFLASYGYEDGIMSAISAPDRESALRAARDNEKTIKQYGRMHTLYDNDVKPRKVIWRDMHGWC